MKHCKKREGKIKENFINIFLYISLCSGILQYYFKQNARLDISCRTWKKTHTEKSGSPRKTRKAGKSKCQLATWRLKLQETLRAKPSRAPFLHHRHHHHHPTSVCVYHPQKKGEENPSKTQDMKWVKGAKCVSVQGEGKMGLKKNEGGTEASFVLPRAKCKFHIFTIFPRAFFGQQGLRFKPKCTSKNDSKWEPRRAENKEIRFSILNNN